MQSSTKSSVELTGAVLVGLRQAQTSCIQVEKVLISDGVQLYEGRQQYISVH